MKVEKKPKYSVIIPVYNGQDFISRAIESLLKQDFKDYEIIVVDDGSIDHTKEVVLKYCDSGIVKYFRKENEGPGIARQYGLNQCHGEYVCFLDADDYVYPNYFEVIEKHMDPSIDILEFEYDSFINTHMEKELFIEGDLLSHFLLPDLTKALWCRVYQYALTQNLEHLNSKYSEDFFINFQMFKKAKKMKCIKDVLYCYDENETSLTRNIELLDFANYQSALIFDYTLSKYPDISKKNKIQMKHEIIVCYMILFYRCSLTQTKEAVMYRDFAASQLKKHVSLSLMKEYSFRKNVKILSTIFLKELYIRIIRYKNTKQGKNDRTRLIS